MSDVTPPTPGRGHTQRVVAVVAAGVGVVGVALGSVFGAGALSKNSDANSGHCTGNSCDATGVSLRKDAVSAGNLSTLFFAVGAVGVASGVVLWLTAPSNHGVQAAAAAGPGTYGAVLRGTW